MRTTTNSHIPTADEATTTAGPTDAARPPLLVTIPEAARILSVSRSTIYELIWHDQLVPVRIGRSVRIRHRDLESFVRNQLPAELNDASSASSRHSTSAPWRPS